MVKDSPKETKSILENKRVFLIAIIVAVIIITAIVFVRFGDDIFNRPPGVGFKGTEHVHAKFAVMLDGTWVSTDPFEHPQYEFANEYIFLDDVDLNHIHRVATGATLGLFFEGLGMEFTEDCFRLVQDTYDIPGNLFERKEFCNESDMQIKLYVNKRLVEENGQYVIQDQDNILIVYDNQNTPTRSYG